MALGLCMLLGVAASQSLRVDSDIPEELVAGGSGVLNLEIVLDDPEGVVDEAVLFLNIVVNNRERNWPQAGHLVFSGAAEDPAVFRRVLSGEELRAGVSTALSYEVRPGAPLDDYALVLQVFDGSQTNPHRVRAQDKLGQVGFSFRLVSQARGER